MLCGMSHDDTPTKDNPLRPLIDAVKSELRAELLAEIRSEMVTRSAEAPPKCVMLSIAETCLRYGVGRPVLKRMIADGRLKAIQRPCRGGLVGQFLHLADCERVLAGRQSC